MLRISILLCAALLITLISCTEDQVEPQDLCANTNYTYTMDVKAIMDTNCAKSGCHDGSTQLSNYGTYQGVYDDRVILRNGINVGIENLIGGRARLTDEEEDLLLCWIDAGAPE